MQHNSSPAAAEQKRMEEALSLFRTLVDQLDDSVEIIDPQTLRILDMNQKACANHGYTREEILSLTIFDLDPTVDQEAHIARTKKLREAGSFSTEGIHRRKDGSTFPVEINVRLLSVAGREYVVAMARDITARKVTERKLQELSRQLLHSQDDERRSIARDLHDCTAQNLFALKVVLRQLATSVPRPSRAVRQYLAEAKSLVEESLREVRSLSYGLHPPMLDESGLIVAIRIYLNTFANHSGVQIELDAEPNFGRLNNRTELALFRAFQECLTNIQRHSQSSFVSIHLKRNADEVFMQVSDNGPAKPRDKTPITPGFGISSMKERIAHLGGRVTIDTGNSGTTVCVWLPASAAAGPPPAHHAAGSKKAKAAAK